MSWNGRLSGWKPTLDSWGLEKSFQFGTSILETRGEYRTYTTFHLSFIKFDFTSLHHIVELHNIGIRLLYAVLLVKLYEVDHINDQPLLK